MDEEEVEKDEDDDDEKEKKEEEEEEGRKLVDQKLQWMWKSSSFVSLETK